uniref:Uncharacterized protein n=1 Tax=Chelonoidis abingdonii TaxID=106734 RepID=A0A8C0INN3_CHEAB
MHFMFLFVLMIISFSKDVLGKNLKYRIYEEQRVGSVIARLSEDVADVLFKIPNPFSVRFRAIIHRGPRSLKCLIAPLCSLYSHCMSVINWRY